MQERAETVQAQEQVEQGCKAHKLKLGRQQVGTQCRLKQRCEQGLQPYRCKFRCEQKLKHQGLNYRHWQKCQTILVGRKAQAGAQNYPSTLVGDSRSPSSTRFRTDAGESSNSPGACTGQAGAQSSPAEKQQNHPSAAARAGALGK